MFPVALDAPFSLPALFPTAFPLDSRARAGSEANKFRMHLEALGAPMARAVKGVGDRNESWPSVVEGESGRERTEEEQGGTSSASESTMAFDRGRSTELDAEAEASLEELAADLRGHASSWQNLRGGEGYRELDETKQIRK